MATEIVDVSSNAISGTLDDSFCNNRDGSESNLISVLGADCGGFLPEVNCSCCTLCCDDVSGTCDVDLVQICQVSAQTMAIGKVFGNGNGNGNDVTSENNLPVVCDCQEDGKSFSCSDWECQSCSTKHDGNVICGVNMDYGYQFSDEGDIVAYSTSFQYTVGRNELVHMHRSLENPLQCRVEVNGHKCSDCGVYYCLDDSIGLRIDCSNVAVEQDGVEHSGGQYDTCSDLHDEGGVLEVLDMFFVETYTGCRPVLEAFVF